VAAPDLPEPAGETVEIWLERGFRSL
jgi:hypothetical protein